MSFKIDNKNWIEDESGNLKPINNDTVDIGSAETKVRDMYISDNSLWIGDDNKISITSSGELRFKKRKKDIVPSRVTTAGGDKAGALAYSGKSQLSDLTLKDWGDYYRNITSDSRKTVNEVYAETSADDWEKDVQTLPHTSSDGHVLTWNDSSSLWEGQAASGGGGGGSRPTMTTVTSTYTITSPSSDSVLEEFYFCNGSGAIDLTLPDVTNLDGFKVNVKNLTSNTVTIKRYGSDTIDGDESDISISYQYDAYTLIASGSGWWIV